MHSELKRKRPFRLNANEVLRLRDAAGSCIRIAQGIAWVTQEGDLRDHVLERGDKFCFDRNGLTLVTALGREAGLEVETRSDRLPGGARKADFRLQRERGGRLHAVESESRCGALKQAV